MAKTIAVSNEVYVLLKRSRMPGESFSKVIKRTFKRAPSLLDIAGSKILTRADWEAVEKHLEIAQRKALNKLSRRLT